MYHIIVNPVAGKKRANKNLVKIEKLLFERNIPFQTHKTCARQDGTAIAKSLTEQGETDFIVLGGDGTLHEVLNGLCDPVVCRLGIIPSGTGNDFAAKIGLPKKAEKALELILEGTAKPTDYLTVGGVRCMNVAGIGMDVDVLERCLRGKLKGKIKYLLSLTRSVFAFKGIPVVVRSEGIEERHEALLAAACNGSQFGGGVRICPVAEVDDNQIDVVVVDRIGGKIKLFNAFSHLLRGKILRYPASKNFRCEKVAFYPEKPVTVQLDGELYRELPIEVELQKGLQIFR